MSIEIKASSKIAAKFTGDFDDYKDFLIAAFNKLNKADKESGLVNISPLEITIGTSQDGVFDVEVYERLEDQSKELVFSGPVEKI